MALNTVTEIEDGIAAIFASLKDRKSTHPRVVGALESLLEIQAVLAEIFAPQIVVVLGDSTDAGVSEAIAVTGELGLAWVAAHPTELTFPIGATFQVSGVDDFTDNALGTAKAGAVASGDIFQITGADAVVYVGSAEPDFSAEERADF